MKVAGVTPKQALVYGGLAVAGYFFFTKILPKIAEGLGRGAGDTAAGAAKGLAVGAGKTAGQILLMAPNAIDAAAEQLGLGPDAMARVGGALGRGIYGAVHAFSPDPGGESIFYTVNFPDGARRAIAGTVVDSKGRFKYQNVMYQIKDNDTGAHFATRL